jgi:uncharacterized protein
VRPELLEILCCPVCRGTLTLNVGTRNGEEIETGALRCAACRVDYPIEEGIPNLLPPNERA